jgi:hypothetical protein
VGREWLEGVVVKALCIKTGKGFESREYWSILRSGDVNFMTQAIVDQAQPRLTGLPALISRRKPINGPCSGAGSHESRIPSLYPETGFLRPPIANPPTLLYHLEIPFAVAPASVTDPNEIDSLTTFGLATTGNIPGVRCLRHSLRERSGGGLWTLCDPDL